MNLLANSHLKTGFSLLAGVLLSTQTLAGDYAGIHPLLSDRFLISLGGYYADQEGSYRYDGENIGTVVDFDSDLGIGDSEWSPSLQLYWRFSEKSQLQLEYFSISKDNSINASRAFTVDDKTFTLGASLNINDEMDILRLFYGYNFIKNETSEIGAGVGLHYGAIDLSVTGDALVNAVPVISATATLDDWAILPNIGFYAAYAFNEKWLVKGRLDWFSASIDEYSGDLWNVGATLQYQITDNFGAGLSYRYLDLEIERDKSGPEFWKTNLEYTGPALFVTLNF